MMSQIHTFTRQQGEIQRVQLVRLDSWEQLEAFSPTPSASALQCFGDIYQSYLIPACPWVFGNLVMFRLPEGLQSLAMPGAGEDPLTAAAGMLRKHLRFAGKKPRIRDAQTRKLWEALERDGCIRTVRGKLPITTIIPVADRSGFLTESMPSAAMKVNGSFFIMDPFDCATVYDHVGNCFGLYVRRGVVERPPLYGREALLVKKDGSVCVSSPDLRQLTVRIGACSFVAGENAVVFTRPQRAWTPGGKQKKLVIVGRRVEAVYPQGRAPIPASGFVLAVDPDCQVQAGDTVTYLGMEDVVFGIQVGNSIVRDGVATMEFKSRFYNIRALQPVPYPPCLYPLKFHASRAARIALGADGEGKPMLLWAEGAAKLGHIPGVDSCGATLAEMAQICMELGMVNAVNLDGGGSAQILLHGHRGLCISDRNGDDHSESERPVPMGLCVKE